MAIANSEPETQACLSAMQSDERLLMSAGTLAELLIVALRRGISGQVRDLLEDLDLEVISVTPASARRAAEAYSKWGKGIHRAALNYGDCFAYELAKQRDCPLLFVGDDFAATDILSALD